MAIDAPSPADTTRPLESMSAAVEAIAPDINITQPAVADGTASGINVTQPAVADGTASGINVTQPAVAEATAPAVADVPEIMADLAPRPDLVVSASSAPSPAQTVATAEAVAPASPTPAAPAEQSPAQQVAEALRAVRQLADGSHRLSLQLHPEDLGAVHLEIAIRDGQLHVRAIAETEAARSAIEQSLPELRSELRDAGVRAGSLEVGPDTSGSQSPNRERENASRSDLRRPDTPTSDPTDPTLLGATALDIRL